ncbi:hypothetical protein PENSPDRAFT_751491 [Peniophora sp. CONT]|nr:hypothetical protein PENSPDRAFT_751491 [Peniophora sp. CONT]
MSTTLPLFWNLSSGDKKERLNASVKLISALERLQTAHVPSSSGSGNSEEESGVEDEEDDEEDMDNAEANGLKEESAMLNQLNAGDVSYSIRRLVRGLASPRESSRLGFSVALTELLSRINTVTCSQILAFVLDASQIGSSLSGQEERDMLFARLFGITAIIRSGLLVRTQPLPSSGSAAPEASSLQGYKDVLSQLLELGEKKAWFRESAWWALTLAVEALYKGDVHWKGEAVKFTLEKVFEEDKAWSPEKIALAVKMQALWPKQDWRKLYAPGIKHGDVLHSANMAAIAKVLKEVEVEEEEEGAKASARQWKPQVHYVWDVLLDELLPVEGSGKAAKGSFQEFFRIVVDESLFAASSSNGRKYWGFEIVQKALPRIRGSDVPMLFTKNFMRTWMNHLTQSDRYLHKFAKQISTSIHEVVKKDPKIGFAFVLQLTGVHGDQRFDMLTKTKTVESILTTMDVEGIQGYIKHLLSQVDAVNGEDAQVTNSRRSWIIEQFTSLVKNGSIPKDDAWIQLVLDWLVVHGVFIVKKKSERGAIPLQVPSPAFADDLRKQCRDRLLACLADLTLHPTLVKSADGKTQKINGVASDGRYWVSRVVQSIGQLAQDTKHVKPVVEFDEDDVAALQKAEEVLVTVKGDGEERQGAELLLGSTMLLQRMAVDDATSTLEACVDGVSKLFAPPKKTSKKKSKKAAQEDVEEESEPEPIDVLVDIIIGFLEKSTAFTRAVGNQSFSLLSGAVKGSTVDLVLAQLERKDPAELLADSESEDEDEMDVDEEEGGDEEDDDEEESDDDEAEDDDEEDIEDDEELRKKLAAALGAGAADEEADESEDDEGMDDEQMMAIDEQLAAIFKEQVKKGKSRGENEQREATHFKNRILDLLDIFVKKQPSSALVIPVILPLVELVFSSSPDEKQLIEKASGLLKSRIGKAKEAAVDADVTLATEVLENLHTRARKVRGADALAVIGGCSLYVSRALVQSGAEEVVLREYTASLVEFAERKASDLSIKFFDDFVKRLPGAAWKMREALLAEPAKAVNAYRQVQLWGLVQTLCNNLPSADADKPDVLAFMTTLHVALSTAVLKECSDPTLTAPQLKDVLKLALHAARQTKRSGSIGDVWKGEVWEKVQTKLVESERFKASTGLHGMVRQLVALGEGKEKNEGKDKKKKSAAKDGLEGDVDAAESGKETKSKPVKAKRKAEAPTDGEPVKKKKAKKSAKADSS